MQKEQPKVFVDRPKLEIHRGQVDRYMGLFEGGGHAAEEVHDNAGQKASIERL